jgi:uncharacterized membrane protein
MGIQSGAFKFVLLLHLVAVVAGFGPVCLNGLYGIKAKRRGGAEGVAIGTANFEVSKIAEYFIYAVPILGFALVGMSDKIYKFSQAWVWLALVLYLVGLAVSHAIVIPSHRRMNVVTAELAAAGPSAGGGRPPQVAEVEQLERKLSIAGPFLNLLVVVIIALMIWKPGF